MLNKKGFAHIFLLFSFCLLLVVSLFILLNSNFFKFSKIQNLASSPPILTSPKPSPTKTPLPIPTHSGRLVTVPILYYHYIGNNPTPSDKARDSLQVTPEKFDEQMSYLSKNGFATIFLDTLYGAIKGEIALPNKSIILTFDDGYIDFYHNAFPVLDKFNLKATVFIPTGLMDQSYYLKWDQIKEMDSSGLISFQAHSVTHPDLTSLDMERLNLEITMSKRILEERLGKTVNFFAYPYGTSDPRVWEAVKKTGYLGAVGTWHSKTHSEGVIFDLPRIRVGSYWDIDEFSKQIN